MRSTPQGFGLTRFTVLEPPVTLPNQWFYDRWSERDLPEATNFDIRKRTGIESRRIFSFQKPIADIAMEMIRHMDHVLSKQGHECEGIVLASTRPDVEDIAEEVRHRMGRSCSGIGWSCSGFPAALQHVLRPFEEMSVAEQQQQLLDSQVMVIWLEVWRDFLNVLNPKVAPLFGDCCAGAGVTNVLSKDKHGKAVVRYDILDAFARRIGVSSPLIWMNECGDDGERVRFGADGETREIAGFHSDCRLEQVVDMNGREVFREAPRRMVEAAVEGLCTRGKTPNDLHAIVPHGANDRMRAQMAGELNRLGYRPVTLAHQSAWTADHITMDIGNDGNVGGGSIPIRLHARDASFESDSLIVTPTVGAGREIGNWDKPISDDPVEEADLPGEMTLGNAVLLVR